MQLFLARCGQNWKRGTFHKMYKNIEIITMINIILYLNGNLNWTQLDRENCVLNCHQEFNKITTVRAHFTFDFSLTINNLFIHSFHLVYMKEIRYVYISDVKALSQAINQSLRTTKTVFKQTYFFAAFESFSSQLTSSSRSDKVHWLLISGDPTGPFYIGYELHN